MKVVLIHVIETDQYWVDMDRVLKKEEREDALNYCGNVASGNIQNVKIKKIIEVDVINETVKELELKLVNYKMHLVEKK